MAFNIQDFITNLDGNNQFSKSDLFDVFITLPSQVSQGSGYGMQQLALQCEVSEIPGKDIAMIDYRHYGFIKRIPHMNQYGHITFNFICTGNLVEKKLFDRWMDLMIPADTGLVNYPTDSNGNSIYESDIMINQYDVSGNLIYTVTLLYAVPTSVAGMSLDWNNDQVHRMSVSFAYMKWISDQTTFGATQNPQINDTQTNYSNQSPVNNNALPQTQPSAAGPTVPSTINIPPTI
jgi:hypothetical protein